MKYKNEHMFPEIGDVKNEKKKRSDNQLLQIPPYLRFRSTPAPHYLTNWYMFIDIKNLQIKIIVANSSETKLNK